MTETFDLLETPLAGVTLIEASAGTGKTYTIAALYLRLILESDLTVEQILVVTFTEAATAELKERIRNRLRQAAGAFEGDDGGEPFLQGLVDRHPDPKTALERLRSAIRDFDEAAIFTIHGFCMRMLRENAFESGGLFDTELLTDQAHLRREVAQDFWRRRFYGAPPMFFNWIRAKGITPDTFVNLISSPALAQGPRIIPAARDRDTSAEEAAYKEAYGPVVDSWRADRDDVHQLLMETDGYDRRKYKKEQFPDWVDAMDGFVLLGPDCPVPPSALGKLDQESLNHGMKNGYDPPTHPFFMLCSDLKAAHDALAEAYRQRLLAWKIELLDEAAGALRQKKDRLNQLSFDDLLTHLRRALAAEGGEALAAAIRSRFKAALIDEFQDTDPIQYEIFKRLFGTPETHLFLIGDPKQAIYGFRGADIFAYMKAKEEAEHRYTLGHNWRSEPALISAVNTIFGNVHHPFVHDAIPFEPVSAPEENPHRTRLTIDGNTEPPFCIWRIQDGNKGKVESAPAREAIETAVAAEIARLISLGREERALIDQRPLQPGDIAVLCRSHNDAGKVRQALEDLGIPSVRHTDESLFDAGETTETERVLRAMAGPGEEGLIRSALATEMVGLSGEEIEGLSRDEGAWEAWLIRFRDLHDLWRRRGFMRAFRSFLSEVGVLPRLMAFPDGERRCTNLLHLAEVLHGAETTGRPGMSGLVKWLSQQRRSDAARVEEYQLRLETDARAVSLVTIHKSKGLEYPVVFCPFIFQGIRVQSDPYLQFHDEEADLRLTLDLGSDAFDTNKAFVRKEFLAENLRLLYVAFTRARNRCVTAWGWFNRANTAAPNWLFHGHGAPEGTDIVGSMAKAYGALDREKVGKDLNRLAEASENAIAVTPLPSAPAAAGPAAEAEESTALGARTFTGTIDGRFRVSSFSGLTRPGGPPDPAAAERADRDPAGTPPPEPPGDEKNLFPDIFAFPRGARAGTLLHEIFEAIDFPAAAASGSADDVTLERLHAHGFDPRWKGAVAGMVGKVLSTPLDPDHGDLALSRIGMADRLTELGFYFPLKNVTPSGLSDLFRTHAGPEIPPDAVLSMDRLSFSPVEGFLMGFIDLVFRFRERFYIVDWKSNHLGNAARDYAPDRLAEAIHAHHYHLQYLLYTVALDRYLRGRMPGYRYEEHFGGVFYLFIRGMDPEIDPAYGVFRDRPPADLVAGLAEGLIDSTGIHDPGAR